jgi:hypothetical protein
VLEFLLFGDIGGRLAGLDVRGRVRSLRRWYAGLQIGTYIGAGAAAETFRLSWVQGVERGCVVRYFPLAGLVRIVIAMRGGD